MDTFELKKRIKESTTGGFIYNTYYNLAQRYEASRIKAYAGERNAIRIKAFEKKEKGKRCFIIGNGPSLTQEDLMSLKGEDTFASNRIYGVFTKCDWRPTYYCVQDEVLLLSISSELAKYAKQCRQVFLPYNLKKRLPEELRNMGNIDWLFYAWRQCERGTVEFSEDCSSHVGASMTVTYAMIQLAVYMGYAEIYLLGVDHNYVTDKNSKAAPESYATFISSTDLKRQNAPHTDLSTLAYEKANEICIKAGVKIWNVTRGGKLEVFERKSLEEALGKRISEGKGEEE